MDYAVISDVHSNLEALQSVLAAIDADGLERIFFLGDIVGYGPDPNECVSIIKEKCGVIVAGNHDHAVAGLMDTTYFNPLAEAAVAWTAGVISRPHLSFIKRMPLTEELPEDGLFFVHATPRDPAGWHYLTGINDARINFHYFEGRICFLGHSHVPFIVVRSPEGALEIHHEEAAIRDGFRYIVNAGSVGQPRDGNPAASFVIVKNGVIKIKRTPYDILLTQKKIRNAGLPALLAERLAAGR